MTTIGVRWRTLDTLYQMTQQIKHHQILEETCFSPEIKHLWGDDNDMFYWSTETMQYQRKHIMSLHNFLFHFLTCQKLGLCASPRIPNTSKQMNAVSVSRCLAPVREHSPFFFNILLQTLISNETGGEFKRPTLKKGELFEAPVHE